MSVKCPICGNIRNSIGPTCQTISCTVKGYKNRIKELEDVCKEMHRVLTSPSRELSDITRIELQPFLSMLKKVV